MRGNFWKVFLYSVGILMTILASCSFFYHAYINNKLDTVGEQIVKSLYHYDNIDELAKNDNKFKELVTPEIYERESVTNVDKSLNVYLKMKQNPVKVEFTGKGPGYVTYTLHTESLSLGREFMLEFGVDKKGVVNHMREFELLPFYSGQ